MTSRKQIASGIRIKRVYDAADPADGYRVLIDRLWPRGVSREEARLDEWARDLAPSRELRRWFGHDPEKFAEFRRRYEEELRGAAEHLAQLRERARRGPLTIVFGARDVTHSNAAVLAELLGAASSSEPERAQPGNRQAHR